MTKTQVSQAAIKSQKTRRKNKVKKSLLAYLAGLIMGGTIPLVTFNVAHVQVEQYPMLWLAVAGGLTYSAPMVYEWFSRYVGRLKSIGFVISLEAAMVFTHGWTTELTLIVLVGLNAIILAKRFTND